MMKFYLKNICTCYNMKLLCLKLQEQKDENNKSKQSKDELEERQQNT